MILAPIVQVGCLQRLLRGDGRELLGRRVQERPARRGEHQARDPCLRFADQALPDGRVLRVDRPQPGERGRERVARVRRPRARPPRRSASAITRWPPATSVSLLAVATTLPARSAASTGRSETTPPVPTTTMSTSSRVASALERVLAARRARCPPGRSSAAPRPRARRRRAAGGAACASSSAALRPVARATTAEPVRVRLEHLDGLAADAPGRAQQRDAEAAAPSANERDDIQRDDGAREQERVDPVEDPAVARDQRPRVLRAGGPLEHRLGEVAGLGRQAQQRARGRGRRAAFCPSAAEHQRRHDRGRDQAADEALDRLGGRDVGQELVAPDLAAHEVGAGVVAPDAEHQQQDPAALGADRGEERRAGGDRRARGGHLEHEGDQADVDRPEHRREPGDEPVSRILRANAPTPGEHDADRHEQDPLVADRAGTRPRARTRPRGPSRTAAATGSPPP